MSLYRTPPHLLFPFGTEPIIFDTLLFVREACQIRRLEVGRPRLAERGIRVETHFVLGFVLSRVLGGRIARFLGGSKVRVMTWHVKKSGPAEGVGVRGRSPWVDNHFQY